MSLCVLRRCKMPRIIPRKSWKTQLPLFTDNTICCLFVEKFNFPCVQTIAILKLKVNSEIYLRARSLVECNCNHCSTVVKHLCAALPFLLLCIYKRERKLHSAISLSLSEARKTMIKKERNKVCRKIDFTAFPEKTDEINFLDLSLVQFTNSIK